MSNIIKNAKNLKLPDLSDAIKLYKEEARFCQFKPEASHLSVIYRLRESFPEKCDYLEIGSLFGFSMVNATRSSKVGKFVGVDLFETTGQIAMNDYTPDVKLRNLSMEKTKKLVESCNVHNHKINFILGNSRYDSTLQKVKEISSNFDLIFIDGDHSYEGCLSDFVMYSPLLRSGGFLLFDDHDYGEIQSVMSYIKENHANDFKWVNWDEGWKCHISGVPKFTGFFIKN